MAKRSTARAKAARPRKEQPPQKPTRELPSEMMDLTGFALLWQLARERHEGLTKLIEAPGDMTIDRVHDLRVMTRRMTEVIQALKGNLRKGQAKQVLTTLGELRQEAGAVRDLDVMADNLHALDVPRELSPLVEGFLAEVPERRAAEAHKLHAMLSDLAVQQMLEVVRQLLQAPIGELREPEAASLKTLADRIDDRRGAVKKEFRRAVEKQTPAALHEARKAAKKLRYALELDGQHKKQIKFLKEVQENLGELHDTHVLMEALKDRAAHSASRNSALHEAFAFWGQQVDQRQARRAAEFFAASYLWMNDRV